MEENKQCPYCGETIKAAAKKCKYCGEWLNKDATSASGNKETTGQIHSNKIGASAPVSPTATRVAAKTNTATSIFKTYFWDVLAHHYADFKGTMCRKTYWMFILLYWITLFIVSGSIACFDGIAGLISYFVLSLISLLPMLAAAVRRMHDIGKSGWMLFISMIPLIGIIYLLILLCKKGTTEVMRAKWCISDTLHVGALGLLVVAGIVQSICTNSTTDITPTANDAPTADNSKSIYIYEDSEWEVNSNATRFFTVATTDKRDLDSGFIDHFGAQVIVSAQVPYADITEDVIELVISAKDIAERDPEVGQDLYYKLFPSTIDPDLLYFNYWQDGMEIPRSGKVDCHTGEFALFNGTIIGMITEGRYEDCFLRADVGIPGISDGLKIFLQSPVGKSAAPIRSTPGDYSTLIFEETIAENFIEGIEEIEN